MAQSSQNAAALSPDVNSGVLWAPIGTPLPTNATDPLDPGFIPLGYVTEDGVSYDGDAAETEDITAWGGDVVLTLATTAAIKRWSYTLMEVFNPDVNRWIFGQDNVTVTAATTTSGTTLAIKDMNTEPARCSMVFDGQYQDKQARYVLPIVQPLVQSEAELVHSAAMGYELQVTAFKSDDGVLRWIYLVNDDVALAA